MKFKEIELKYRSNSVDLRTFKDFCLARLPVSETNASGYDHFYAKKGDKSTFARHRVGADINQLTFKRKIADNNFIRDEHNLDLAKVSEDQMAAFMSEFGYKFNVSIFKSCFIFAFDKYLFVYYVVYDTRMKELGRFIEAEMAEDYPWKSEAEAWTALLALEKDFATLGLTKKNRAKLSLFEMFKKGTK